MSCQCFCSRIFLKGTRKKPPWIWNKMIPTTRSLEGRWFFWKGTTNRTSTPCFSFICDCSMLGKKFQTYATKWWSKWWFTMVESVKKKVQFEIFLVLFWFLVSDNYNPRLFAEMVWGKGHLVASSCRCSWNFAWRAPNGPQENLAQPGVGWPASSWRTGLFGARLFGRKKFNFFFEEDLTCDSFSVGIFAVGR